MTNPLAKARNEKYLRNRPFLIVNTVRRAAKSTNTSKAGWGDTASNWENFEQPSVVDRVSNKHLTEATVIIDITGGVCVKNRYETEDDQVVHHYLTKYREQVSEAMDIWLTQQAKTMVAEQTEEALNATFTLAAD